MRSVWMFPLPPLYLIPLFTWSICQEWLKKKNKAETEPKVHLGQAVVISLSPCGGWFWRAGRQTDRTHPRPYPAATFGNTWSPSSRWAGRAPAWLSPCLQSRWSLHRRKGVSELLPSHRVSVVTPNTDPRTPAQRPYFREVKAKQRTKGITRSINFNFEQVQSQSYKVCNWREPSSSFGLIHPSYKWRKSVPIH